MRLLFFSTDCSALNFHLNNINENTQKQIQFLTEENAIAGEENNSRSELTRDCRGEKVGGQYVSRKT